MTRTCRLTLHLIAIALFAMVIDPARAAEPTGPAPDPLSRRVNFEVAGRPAFVIEPPEGSRVDGPMPWVWYAPTLGKNLPGDAERWMFERFHAKGIAIAGIDVGESYGSPKGRAIFQKLYEELTTQRGYGKKPVLLARSRGGLMLYNWAAEHPELVAGIAGIYPVSNLESYPGLKKAAPAYEMTEEQLKAHLAEHNPIDRLAPLAKAKVPILHIHGDVDKVVPCDKNSSIIAERYKAMGGEMTLIDAPGQGHNMWPGFFQCQELVDFVIARFKQ
ncbi:MAG: prolyl oligopeptidase family serine peptidase [Phycisphaera sp.]|nr:prolyl oligopeptidase family serine peptidase [Phycisphaera sp.]